MVVILVMGAKIIQKNDIPALSAQTLLNLRPRAYRGARAKVPRSTDQGTAEHGPKYREAKAKVPQSKALTLSKRKTPGSKHVYNM